MDEEKVRYFIEAERKKRHIDRRIEFLFYMTNGGAGL